MDFVDLVNIGCWLCLIKRQVKSWTDYEIFFIMTFYMEMLVTKVKTPIQQPLIEDSLSKPAPER